MKCQLTLVERARIIALSKDTSLSYRGIARRVKCSVATVHNILRLMNQTKNILPRARSGRPRKLNNKQRNALRAAMRSTPNATLNELVSHLHRHHNILVSTRTVHRERFRNHFHPATERLLQKLR
jgi:transposase